MGILLGWVGHCSYKPKESPVEVISVRTDTIVNVVEVKVPVPEQIYVTITDSILQYVTNERLVQIYTDTSGKVQTNMYIDSISDTDYKLKYQIQTLGELLSFSPELEIYKKTETVVRNKYLRPKWMVGGAFSSNANFKVGLGYKGWTVETEFRNKINQVWLGKQFNF